MADVLKVLMMGGQRAGKTSMLSGLIETMTNGKVKDLVEVQNVTSLEDTNRKLSKSIESLKYNLITSYRKTFLIDDNKTSAFDDYTLEFRIPNTESVMQIVFTDANGEFYDMGRLHDQEIREKIRTYDVFVIAIDTSASTSGDIVRKFIRQTFDLLKNSESFFRKINVHIIQCDSEVKTDDKITDSEALDSYLKDMKIVGGGATDFRPVFSYVEDLRKKGELKHLRGLMYFTDGLGDYPDKPTDYDTAFVYPSDKETGADKMPNWAIQLYI